jgi:capsular exopolysaccharide synthesis family protein
MNDNTEVKLHFLDYWRVIKNRMGLILLTFFLVMVTSGVYVFFLPRQYYSRVTVEIKPDNNKGLDPINMGGMNRADPTFISTQFNILKKTEILYPVIQKLDLVSKLSPAGSPMSPSWVARVLEKSMNVQEQRNTTLIEVGIYNTDARLAADIANTIATTYRDKRIDDLKKNVDQTLAEMRDELDNKRTDVKNLFAEAAKIRTEESIIDADPENSNALVSLSEKPLFMTEQTVVEKRTLVDQLRNTLTRIEELKPEELLEALRTLNIDDPTMLKTLPQLQDAQSEEAKLLNSGLGENHMRVRSLRAQRDVYRATLAQQLDSIKRSQRTKLSIEEINLKTIEDKLSDLRAKQIKEKTLLTGYVEKKANYLSAKSLLMAIEQRYAAAKFDQVLSTIPVKIWEKAEPGLYPEKPKVPVYMLLAALIGIVVGVGLAFFIEYLDTSVKTIEDIEKYLSLTVLAVVPRDIAVLIKQKRDSADAEVYRILKANIEFNQADREANSYTLVSGGPGEGKSTTLNNLAYTYAKSGARVLVVDADLRRPSQHRFFDIDNSVGLADYIQHKAELEAIIKPTKLENLSFIPSGKLPQDDAGILNSPRMGSLISQLKKQYDIVFLDSPPILGVSDASMLVSEVDNTIMVVQHRRFPRGMLQRVKQTVAHVGGNLIGVVLNNVDTRQDDSYSYYSNYNDYYAPHKDQGAAEKKTKATANALNDEGEKY